MRFVPFNLLGIVVELYLFSIQNRLKIAIHSNDCIINATNIANDLFSYNLVFIKKANGLQL